MIANGCVCCLVIGIWQWFRRMTFSVIKPKSIPPSNRRDTARVNQFGSIASGNKWKKASPNSAPAEKLTNKRTIFLSIAARNPKVTIPIKATALTTKTLISAYTKAILINWANKQVCNLEHGTRDKEPCTFHLVPYISNYVYIISRLIPRSSLTSVS